MMEDIKQLRKRIDAVDEQIMQALSERVKICKAIGSAKKEQGLPTRDVHRENEVYQRVKQKAPKLALDPRQTESVYREIVNMCSSVQELKEKCE
jgi:chorismate mutase